jgi:Uma2 family endonuclease
MQRFGLLSRSQIQEVCKIFSIASSEALMTQPIPGTFQWTTADLELLPDDGRRYEIIDGELFVTRAPHWGHQQVCGRVFAGLDDWSQSSGLGCASVAPGIIFSDADNVIPDVVWASRDLLATILDEAGHLLTRQWKRLQKERQER